MYSRRRRSIFDIIKEFERELEKEFEELIERFFGYYESRSLWSSDGSLEPLINISEFDDKYVIVIDLPLADLRTLSITGKYNKLEIKCQLKRSLILNKWIVQRQTIFKEYRKVLTLPSDADVAKFEVRKFEDKSIIEIVVPKKIKT